MDRQKHERVEERLEALGIETSPIKEQFVQIYGRAVSELSEAKELLESVEGEQHGSLEYAVSSIDTDLRLIKKQRGQQNYRDLLDHINELEEVNKKLLRVGKLCRDTEALFEWLGEVQQQNDFQKDDLKEKYETAKRMDEEVQHSIQEIQVIAEERLEIVNEFLELVKNDQERSWSGSSQGLKYAVDQLNSIIEQDF